MADINKDQELQKQEEHLKKEEQVQEEENEKVEEEELSVDVLFDILEEQILNPELELDEETQNQLLYFLNENAECVNLMELFHMAQESGAALARKDELMSEIRVMVESIKEQYPGYQNMNWKEILEDVGSVRKFKTVLTTDYTSFEGMNGVWVREKDERYFRKATLEDLYGDCDFDRLTVESDTGEFRIRYYSTGEFTERPTLLVRRKEDPEDQTFSIITHSVGRSVTAGGRMQYSGSCEPLKEGEYEISLMTNLKKLDKNGRIICE